MALMGRREIATTQFDPLHDTEQEPPGHVILTWPNVDHATAMLSTTGVVYLDDDQIADLIMALVAALRDRPQ